MKNKKYVIFNLYLLLSAIDCGSVPETNGNLTVTVTDTGYLDTMNYTCDEGHYFSDNSGGGTLPGDNETLHISVCEANELWSIDTTQICERELYCVSLILGFYFHTFE